MVPMGAWSSTDGSGSNASPAIVSLWEGTPVRARSVTLAPFLPDEMQPLTSLHGDGVRGASGSPAIIVCPGGSYCWLDYETEGIRVAEWLQREGIAAFVLKYRVQGLGPYIFHTRLLSRGHQHPDALCDVQRAIQYVREHAADYGIDPQRLGVMGFSAGGHLSMSAAAYASTDFLSPLGIQHTVSLRPDFVAPIYPVVTMQEPYAHKRSRRALLGEYRKRSRAMRDSLSLELHIPADCPPVYLLCCKDDNVVSYHNSALLDSALTANAVPHKFIMYARGGHGFGADAEKFIDETSHWQESFIEWLQP